MAWNFTNLQFDIAVKTPFHNMHLKSDVQQFLQYTMYKCINKTIFSNTIKKNENSIPIENTCK